MDKDWKMYIKQQQEIEIQKLVKEENLKEAETRKFINNCFIDGYVKTNGTDIVNIMPKIKKFGGGNYSAKKQTIIEKIQNFFSRFFGLISPDELQNITVSNDSESECIQYSLNEPVLSFVAEDAVPYSQSTEKTGENR